MLHFSIQLPRRFLVWLIFSLTLLTVGFIIGFGVTPVAQASAPDEPTVAQAQAGVQEPDAPPEGLELTEEEWQALLDAIATLESEDYTSEEIPVALVDEFGYPEDLVQALVDAGIFEANSSQSAAATDPKPIELTPLTLSAEIAQPGAPVTIQTDVSGDQLAYLYSFIGRFLPREDVLLIEDIDYIFADESKEVGSVVYPDWPADTFNAGFDWEPTIYAISDGQNAFKALFEPVAYDVESPVYAVNGTYYFASGGLPRFAKMHFQDGTMTEIFGYTGSITQAIGTPRQITPTPGDQFTVLERGDDLTKDDDTGRESIIRKGGTLTFGDQPFFIETTPAPSGNYVVGIIAEDLDGYTFEQYEGLFVVNDEGAAVDGFKPYVSEELGFALLYPELWAIEENVAEGWVDFFDEFGSALATISRSSYPTATTSLEADDQAIEDIVDLLNRDDTLENLQFVTEVQDTVLGGFDGRTIDFTFDLDGQPYYGYAIAATPVPSQTYVALVSALDADFDALAPDFDDMLYSFDILISGVSKEQDGPPPPDFASQSFSDDFSDPASGLGSDEAEQDWGRGFYDAASGQYRFELKPDPGAIYDYYADQSLPSDFLLQVTASYTGAIDNSYGLIFQVQADEQSDQFYTFNISGDGFYTVEKTDEDQLVPIIEWTTSNLIDQTEGAANVLTIEGQGDTYNLYINGQQVDSFTDATYSGGSFGFLVDNYDETLPTNLIFDDLTVGLAVE